MKVKFIPFVDGKLRKGYFLIHTIKTGFVNSPFYVHAGLGKWWFNLNFAIGFEPVR